VMTASTNNRRLRIRTIPVSPDFSEAHNTWRHKRRS
jgi:hypothetical protein